MIVLGRRVDNALTFSLVALTMILLFFSLTLALSVRGGTVAVDGVAQTGAVTTNQVAGIAYIAATNVVNAKLVGNVYGSTGITNVWTGNQAAYDAIQVKDSKTLYFIEE